jgi:predicted Na+-dependent transporter
MDPLQWLVKGTLVVFVVSSMLSIGLAVQRAQIVAPLRSPAWILRALVANFVLAPVVALSIGAVLPIDPGYERHCCRSWLKPAAPTWRARPP